MPPEEEDRQAFGRPEERKQPEVGDAVSRTRRREKGLMQEKLRVMRGQKGGFGKQMEKLP